MSLMDQYTLATNGGFIERVQAAIIAAASAIYNEVANDVQTLSLTQGTATGGTFTLTFSGQTTSAIAYNASAGTVQLALANLVGTGNVLCTGGSLPGSPIAITFQGSMGAQPQNAITIANTLTGTGTPTYGLTHTSTGVGYVNHTLRAILAGKVLANPSGYASLFAVGVATNTQVQTDYLATGANPANVTDADISNAVSALWNCYA